MGGLVDGGALARQRVAGTQPAVQQVHVLGAALDVPVYAAVLRGALAAAVKDLRVVAGVVDDDVVALLGEVLDQVPLDVVGEPRGLVEGDGDQSGSQPVVVEYHRAGRAAEERGERALAGPRRAGHLDDELARRRRLLRGHGVRISSGWSERGLWRITFFFWIVPLC